MHKEYGTLRSPWMFLEWVIGLCALLLGVTIWMTVGFDEGASVIIPCMVPGGWISLAMPLAGVRVNENGVKYRGIVKFWSVPWVGVKSVRSAVKSEGHIFATVVPVLETTDGREMELALLAGYSASGSDYNQRVESQVGQIENLSKRVI